MSSSDSEDDEQMRQFMEAADTSLLNNSMFAQKDSKQEESTEKTETPKPQDLKGIYC